MVVCPSLIRYILFTGEGWSECEHITMGQGLRNLGPKQLQDNLGKHTDFYQIYFKTWFCSLRKEGDLLDEQKREVKYIIYSYWKKKVQAAKK